MEKITKRDFYTALITFAQTGNIEISNEDIEAFAAHEIELLDNRAAKAKETKAKKAKEPDAFAQAITDALTDEFQTAADIVTAIDNADLSVSKAIYRLNALVEAGIAVKEDIKIPGQRSTRKGFKRA